MRGGSRALFGNQPRGMHVLTWLRDQGTLTPSSYEGVLHQATRTGARVEDCLIDTGVVPEAELLKLLAERYGTQFVSSARLAKATIDRATLDTIPHKLAERLLVFPVVFDRRAQRLSVVVAAPGEDDVEKQVQVVSGVREVRALVARPAAIRAAIEKFYNHTHSAFDELSELAATDYNALDLYDGDAIGGAQGSPGDFDAPSSAMGSAAMGSAAVGASWPEETLTPSPRARVAPPLPLALDGTIPADFAADGRPSISFEGYLETLAVFVSLLERDRGELRGHSGQVARLCRSVAERVGLTEGDRHALLVAAYLHDVGKTASGYHLTALNVARYEGHRGRADKSRLSPVRLFEAAPILPGAQKILAHMYERFDGQGFPDRLAGKDIPYGARVLAIVETYTDLITNEQNPYRRVLSVPQALSVLRELGGQLFDPTLADLLVRLVVGEGDDALGTRPRALVVDPDPEETMVIELRLSEHGFAVRVARDLESAKEALAEPFDVIVTEVDLRAGLEGFSLMRRIQELSEDERPAVIFLTSRADRESVTKGFELGAADYLVKPASAEVVAAKAEQAVEGAMRKRVGGVSGSLKEMSLPDVVQILCNGRRGGRLELVSGGRRGEIHFSDGNIVDARFESASGEEAVYALLRLDEGTFSLDPAFKPGERAVYTSAEGLLLEGMRRLDEGIP